MAEDLPMGSCPSSTPPIPPHTGTVPSVARSGSPIPSELRQRVPAIFGGHPPPFMERKRSSIVMGQVFLNFNFYKILFWNFTSVP